MSDILDKYLQWFSCKTGKHRWGTRGEAERCCNGWVKVKRLLPQASAEFNERHYVSELVPIDVAHIMGSSDKIDIGDILIQSH